jgi:hypothetical protein
MPRKTGPKSRKAAPAPPRNAKNAYEALGVSAKASQHEIRSAYRRLALAHHPDRQPEGEREQATERFKTLNDAYQKISTEEKRLRYDALGDDAEVRGGRSSPAGAVTFFIRDRLQFIRTQAARFAWDTQLNLPQWVRDGMKQVIKDEHGALEQIEVVSRLSQAPEGLTLPNIFKEGYVIATGLHLAFVTLTVRLESHGNQLREIGTIYSTAIPWPALDGLSVEEHPTETHVSWVRLGGSRNSVRFPVTLLPLGRLLTLAQAWMLPIEAPRTRPIRGNRFVQKYSAAINATAMASFLTALSLFIDAGCGAGIWIVALPVCVFFLSRGSIQGGGLYESQVLEQALSGQPLA